ncbi:hypothetical protein ABZ208_07130 [Streptomyces sp. NPDC006208]|uniref:hypothetical protein n=1 Tax=Streptomyces sp. NPDC006208 TaxID=3156734 RepID=UPI0033A018BE
MEASPTAPRPGALGGLTDLHRAPIAPFTLASTSLEGFNGYANSPLAETIEAGGSRRIRGITAGTVLLAFPLAHANRRKIKQRSSPAP